MNILMMTSPVPKFSPFYTGEKRPPLGLGYLMSILKKNGHTIYFSDEYIKRTGILNSKFLFRNKIDYVGIYSNTICFQGTLELLNQLQNNRIKGWKGKILVGGPHTSVNTSSFPDYVDHIVIGEGENVILDIVEGNFDERIIKGTKVEDLDDLPTPTWEEFIKLPYNWKHKWYDKYPIFTLNTSRGCPFNCTFCSVCSIWGRTYRTMSARRIFKDIEYLIQNYNAKGIYFREDNFTLNKKRVEELCNLFLENNIDIFWFCESRVDSLLDKNHLKLMKKAGCKAFYIGVESGSPNMLKLMNKGITIDQIKKAFENTKKIGIKTYASFIYGLPNESKEDIRMTEDLIKDIKPDFIGKNVFVGIPGSDLYNYVKKNRLYEYEDENGLLYLVGHNKRVNRYYKGNPYAKIPLGINKFEIIIFKTKKLMISFLKGSNLISGVFDYLRKNGNIKFSLVRRLLRI